MSGSAPSLILASASPRRLELLRQVGIIPEDVIPAALDETPDKHELPAIYARRIAAGKAEKIALCRPASFVLAADTVVACGRRILPKAETAEQARDCLSLLSGRRHRVITAITVISPAGLRESNIVTSAVRFKRLTKQEMEAYIASMEWQGKAGGYAIQGQAATLIPFISGSYSAIVGLPLFETVKALREAGYERV